MAVDLSGDYADLEPYNLDPRTGVDPTSVRMVRQAAQQIIPETSSAIIAPVSLTAAPPGTRVASLAPEPGQAVDLGFKAPAVTMPMVAPVIEPGSVAPQVQTAQAAPRATEFSAQSRGPVAGGPNGPAELQPREQITPGAGEGIWGTQKTIVQPYKEGANDLEIAQKNLQGRAQALESIGRHPWNQLMYKQSADEAIDKSIELRLKSNQVNQAIQQQKDIQAKGANAGLNVGPLATDNTIVEELTKKMLSGDPVAATQAAEVLAARGHKDLVEGHQSQMISAMEGTIRYRQELQQRLDNAKTDADYNKVRSEIGTEAERAGFTVPKSLGEWEKTRAQRDEAGRKAMVKLQQYQTLRAEQGDYTPTLNKEAATVAAGKATYPDGTPMFGAKGVDHKGNMTTGGQAQSGSHILRDYGRTWNSYTSGKEGAAADIEARTKEAFPTTEREKHIGIARAIKMATTDPETGKPMDDEKTHKKINTNPNVQQAIVEALAAALRGGAGGANGQLIKVELTKRGVVQGAFDSAMSAWAGGKGVVTGKEGAYLTQLTQGQIRYVLDFLKDYNQKDIQTRMGAIAERAGMYGAKASDLPLEKEIQDVLKDRVEIGRDKMIEHMGRQYRVVGDDYSTFVGTGRAAAAVPGAVRTPVPATALPALYPELQAPPPAASAVAPGGGSPPSGPVTPNTPGGGVPSSTAPNVAPIPGGGGPAAPAGGPPAGGGSGASTAPVTGPSAGTSYSGNVGTLTPERLQEAGRTRFATIGTPTAPIPPTVPTPQAPGGPGTAAGQSPPPTPAPAGSRPGGTFSQAVPSNGFPAHIINNHNARTIYGVAGQTAQNVSSNPVIANNSAIVTLSSAQSESAFNPNEIHDNKTGQGLFGHRQERLAALQRFAGVPATGRPGDPIPANVQTSFFVREMSQAADSDPFIARTLANPNATAEDLTRVQIRMERPRGYTGPGTEEQAMHWDKRLANTRAAMGGGGVAEPATAVVAAAPAAPLPVPSGSFLNPKNALQAIQQKAQQVGADKVFENAPNYAPAVLGTTGAVVGGTVAGPPGAYAGGVVGGMAGGGIKNYFGPEENQTVGGVTKDVLFGGAQGVVSAIPGVAPLATAARVGLSGAIPGFEKFVEGKDASEIFDATAWGMVGGAVGEGFGRALGAAGNAMWGSYSKAAQAELMSIGKTLAEEQPKIMTQAGKMVTNPVYEKAAARAKQLGQDVDNLSHAWTTAEKDVTRTAKGDVASSSARIPPSKGEALTARPGQVEQLRVTREELNPIKDEVQAGGMKTSPNVVRPGTFVHDPTKIVGVHPDVPNTQMFRDAADAAKLQMNQPANSWREIWDNQVKARAKMLQLEREAIPKGEGKAGEDGYRAIADEVRAQQKHIVERLLPKKQANVLMQRLDVADKAYRRAKTAGGNDIVQVISTGGDKGREALAAFNQLVGDDAAAKQMMASLLKLHLKGGVKEAGKYGAAGVAMYVAAHLPGPGQAIATGIGMYKGFHLLRDFVTLKGSGATVKFGDLVKRQLAKDKVGRLSAGANVLGAAAAPVAAEAAGLTQ